MKYASVIIVLAAGAFYLFSHRSATHSDVDASNDQAAYENATSEQQAQANDIAHVSGPTHAPPPPQATAQTPPKIAAAKPISQVAGSPRAPEEIPNTHAFTVEDGVALIDHDVVIGQAPEGKTGGIAQLPQLELWPSHEVPYYVQPSLSNPDRVQEAIKLFDGTAVVFVPYSGQDDVLVFEEGTGTCKSYVGKIGGKQPIWISPGCGPSEMAHEMMHALGFVHEQNRSDRDQFITLNRPNIDSKYLINFEKMPEWMMTLSTQEAFDFESIMIYPPNMFSSNRQATMTAKNSGQKIEPMQTLSPIDRKRINDYYSNR